ncbi:hypothetical protein B0H21DRAFT_860657 [Amylocystis lapponica]|nr:hypothetical protein B0H21DRAFT_860657 [Amylocystis lapponica]
MNFLDTYDISELNEEVSQVVGQLSRFWGGFRKQTQTALAAAQKDIGEVVSQAQKEIIKLTAEVPAATPTSEDQPEQPTAGPSTAKDIDSTSVSSGTPSEDEPSTTPTQTPTQPEAQPQTLLSRLQSSLPPNLVSSVQSQLPESLKHARVGSLTALDFVQLRSTISTEIHRVQGATEEYVHRSEELFREAGEFLKDAVRVVPPEEGAEAPGMYWDGTDMWMLPTGDGGAAVSGSGKGKERESSVASGSRRPAVDGLRAVATRAESLLKQLRHDPEVIKADPETDERARELYASWVEDEVDAKDGGINGAEWTEKIAAALNEAMDGPALQTTLDTLVPSAMPSETFWTRYFFRVHQVEREEERRKALIRGTVENDEDFSWEDDEDEATSPTTKASKPVQSADADSTATLVHPVPATTLRPATVPRSGVSTPAADSPRLSSEDSYDVVSSQVSNNGNVAETQAAPAKEGAEEEEVEGSDDGEDDDDDDDDEDEDGEGEGEGEGSADSDWE